MPIGKPTAIMQLKTGPNGEQQMVYVDPATGQEVTNPTGYAVTDSNSLTQVNPLQDENPNKQSAAKQMYPRISPLESGGGRDTGASHGSNDPRNPSNNFGYVDKPGWMSMLSAAPGAIGMAGKAVNVGINANNNSAISAARDAMDVPDQSFGEKAKGLVSDRHGFVGDYHVNKDTYGVSMEAMTPDGRTALTPNEARTRAQTGTGISPATKAASEANKALFDRQNPQHHNNFVSSIKDHLSSLLDGLFGPDDNSASFQESPKAQRPNENGPWGGGSSHTGYGKDGTSGQSVGPSGGGQSWGGPH